MGRDLALQLSSVLRHHQQKVMNSCEDGNTVDGRNLAPVDRYIYFLSLSTRFYTSQVVQDFFHQVYV